MWRSVLPQQYEKGGMEPDEANLSSEWDEGFDRADFRVEFSPSPNLEGPRDNASRAGVKSPAETSSPPRARTNSDGKTPTVATLSPRLVRFPHLLLTCSSLRRQALLVTCSLKRSSARRN